MSVSRLEPDQLHDQLPAMLAGPQELQASPGAVVNFEYFLNQTAAGWVAFGNGRFSALCAILPGKVGFLLFSTPADDDPEHQQVLTRTCQTAKTEFQQHYAQALIEPHADAKAQLLISAGFARLTALHYLERGVIYPWVEAPEPNMQWDTFDESTLERFETVINDSYIDSSDCPELIGRRPMEDILAAHQAGGNFDPSLWFIAKQADRDLGCVLINPQPVGSMAELVYLGVPPRARRKGYGRILIQKTLHSCRLRHFERLLVVVDERNAPARKLYDDFRFRLAAKREAYLCFD